MADQSIGKAIIVNGTVKAQSTDGVERILQPNSPVFLDDRINTGAEGAISIVFNDAENTQLDLGRMTEMVIDNSVLAAEEVDLEEVTAEVAAIQQALESGGEIEIAETAAGPTAGAAGDGGGGRPIYKDEIDGKEGEVTSGAETEGVTSGFTGVLLDVVAQPQAVTVAAVAPEPLPSFEPEPEPVPVPDDDPDPELFPPVDYDVAVEANYYEELPFTFAGSAGDLPVASDNILVDGLGGLSGFGENAFAANDDGSVEVDITPIFGAQGLNVGGTFYTSIFINNNGNITFDSPQSTYTPFAITGATGNPIIAPYFADVDTRGGTIPSYDTDGNSTGSNLVYWDIDTTNGVLTITWDDVGYYGSNTDKSNAFQLRIFDQGDGDFGFEFRFEDVNWTTGDASGGSGGLGGTVATAGWSAGDGVNWFQLPQSSDQAAMLQLEDSGSNIGVDGIWQFNVQSGEVNESGPELGPGYLYEFEVGEADIVADNIHGTDLEDGVTTQFTITSLPTTDGVTELGRLLIDRGNDQVVEEIYGDGFDPLPAGGLDVQTGDSVYYFLEEGTFEVLPESVSFDYFTTDSDGMVSNGAVISISFEDIPDANPGAVAVDEEGLPGGNPDTEYGDGSDLAGDDSAVTGNLSYDFGDNGPHADTPFSWSNLGLPVVTSAGASVTYDVVSDGLQLIGHTGELGDPVLTLSLVNINTGEYEFEVLKPLDHDTANTEDDIVFEFGYTVMDGDGDESSSVLTATVDDDSPELTGEYQSHQVEEEGLNNFDPDHDVDGDSIEGSTGNEDVTGDEEFGGPGLVTATGDLSAMVSGGVDEPLTFGFVDDVQTALESANNGLTSQEEDLNYNVVGNTLTATSDDGRDIFTLEITDTSTGAYEFTLIDQLDHAAPPPGTAVENSLTLNLGAALEAVDSDGDAVGFSAIDTGDGDVDGLTVTVADDIPIAKPVENESIPQNMNLLLILDNSGSMTTDDRIGDLNDAMADLFAGIGNDTYLTGAENVRVHVVSYNTTGTTVGTYDLKVGGADQSQSWSDIGTAGWTNYEDGMFEALQWIHEDWPGDLDPDLDGVSPDDLPPLSLPETVNKVVFLSDGLPNTVNAGSGDDANPDEGAVSATVALDHATGDAGLDTISELDALKAWADGGVEAVGIELDELSFTNQAIATEALGEISSDGNVINVEFPENLGPILGSLLPVSNPIPIVSATVEEDDLDSSLDATDDLDATAPTDDSVDGINEDGSDDKDEADDVLAGNLSELFLVGADEELTFSLNPDGILPTLYSGGQTVTYDFSTPGTLVASAGTATVFTFSVENDGSWSFDLDGKLDHVEGDGENFALVSGDAGDESVDGIDFSSVILATDADEDAVPATPGAFVIEVQDDVPDTEGAAVGYAFGISSYTGAEGDFNGADHQVVFDILAEYGSDGPQGGTPDINLSGQTGDGIFQVIGDQVVFTPDENWSGQSEITYEITDGDGDTSEATLTVIENKLIVGDNVDDVGPGTQGNDFPYVVGEGADGLDNGTIDGGAGNDILIGDYGGSQEVSSNGDVNLLFILDVSGSMGGDDDRLGEMKTAVNNVLTKINQGNQGVLEDAVNVRVHIVTFNTNSNTVGTYDIKGGGSGTVDGGITDAVAAVTGITETTDTTEYWTNYEAGMQNGLSWVNTDSSYTSSGSTLRAEADGGPLEATLLTNQVLFLTDGEPNHYLDDSGTVIPNPATGSTAVNTSMEQILGNIYSNGNDGSDSAQEVTALQTWGTLTAVGMNITEGTTADGRLDLIDESGDADNVDDPVTLEASIVDALVETETALANVGDDTILGGGGDDLIYGDAVYTDGVWADLGVDTPVNWSEGDGWAVFEELENGGYTSPYTGEEWSRTDTINYILEHQAELAQETTIAEDPDGRQGGDDILNGDAGDDVIFGQEGDDDISGGEDNDLLVGGTGEDDIAGDAGNDLLVGDAIEITPDDSIGTPDTDDFLEVDVIDDGETDDLDGGAGEDTIVDDELPTDETIQPDPGTDVDEVIAEGDTAEIGGEEIDPLILLIPEDPGAV